MTTTTKKNEDKVKMASVLSNALTEAITAAKRKGFTLNNNRLIIGEIKNLTSLLAGLLDDQTEDAELIFQQIAELRKKAKKEIPAKEEIDKALTDLFSVIQARQDQKLLATA